MPALVIFYRCTVCPTATDGSHGFISSKIIRTCLFLTDKAGGKKFSKDFEEGSAQLQEFVKFLDKQSKTGPPVMELLSNADIFYETQYKEVKIVANVSGRCICSQIFVVLSKF